MKISLGLLKPSKKFILKKRSSNLLIPLDNSMLMGSATVPSIHAPKGAEIAESLSDVDPEIIVFHDYEEALIGYIERAGGPSVALYDKNKIIQLLIERDGLDEDDALDHYYYNIVGSYLGEYSPVFGCFDY